MIVRSNFTLSQVGPNILFISGLTSIHFQFCFEYINPCFTTLCSQMLSLAIGSNFQVFHPRQPQQPLIFLYYLLIDQLHAKEVYFCSFVTKCNQASTKYSPDVFKSFYRTVTHGQFHRIFTSPASNGAFPHFTIEPLPYLASPFFLKKTPSPLQKIHNISIGPSKPPHTLLFRLKQNSLFGGPFFPHTGTPPQRYMQFQ